MKTGYAEPLIVVTVNGHKVSLPTQNIIYIYVQTRKLHIITTKGEIVTGDTFDAVEAQLRNNSNFCEPHRSYLVNLEYVQSYDKDKIFCAHSGRTYEVYLSRRKYDDFSKRFVEWIGGSYED